MLVGIASAYQFYILLPMSLQASEAVAIKTWYDISSPLSADPLANLSLRSEADVSTDVGTHGNDGGTGVKSGYGIVSMQNDE
jgi:hypothetical protein